ncbi:MAG: hypothetical protein N2645_13215 [Clostridia bacterium]|nr:hypothetical protein [Clostridia bacterium]
MDENLKYWFQGFEDAIANMKQQERESLFCKCGKNCADRWVLNLYKNLYSKVNGDMDLFFLEINSAEGVKGEIVEPGKKYHLFFKKCSCGLHTEGYVNSPFLCECSRQSIIYVFNSMIPNKKLDVKICSTILRGGDECKFSITMHD